MLKPSSAVREVYFGVGDTVWRRLLQQFYGKLFSITCPFFFPPVPTPLPAERRQSPTERMSLLGGRLARTGSSLLRSLRGGRAGGITRPLEHRVSTSLFQKTAATLAFLGLNHHPRPYLRNLLDMHSPNPLPQPNSLDPVLFPAKISSAFQPLKSDGVKEIQGHRSNCGLTELKSGDRHALVV